MSLYWSKFTTQENNISKDDEHLYRIRDFDDPNINKAKLVNWNFLFPHRDSQYQVDKVVHLNLVPSDPIWETMNETERVENGLPTKFSYKLNSYYHLTLFAVALGNNDVFLTQNFYFILNYIKLYCKASESLFILCC